jgi:hypothetical protein
MNHHFTPLTPTSARLVMESAEPFMAWKQLTIVRLYFNALGTAVPGIGAVLGSDPGQTSAMILDVRQRDLVVVYSRVRKGSRDCTFTYYRVTDDWNLQLLRPDVALLKSEGFEHLIQVTDQLPDRQVDSRSETLRDFLAGSHPTWLESILMRQVEHWRYFKPEQFFRLAPSRMTDREFVECFLNYPLLTLANFKTRLTRKQLRSCIRRSLQGGVIYAFDELSPAQIKKAEARHPAEMIQFAADRLTDAQLRRVAAEAPWTAFCCCPTMSPARQALVLSVSYCFSPLLNHSTPKALLEEEIIRSITDFPVPWLYQHGNDYETLLLALWHHLEFAISTSRLRKMLLEMPEEHREPLVRYLTNGI